MFSKFIKLTLVCLAGSGIIAASGCSDDSSKKPVSPTYKTGLSVSERGVSAYKDIFPEQYGTYMKNNETGIGTATKYKASFPFAKNDNVNQPTKGYPQAAQPYLKNLWLGYPFSYEYNEARGHTYAVADILHIDRINRYGESAGLPSTCWNCKTTKVLDWQKEYGDKFWAMNFNEFRDKAHISEMENSISCDTCHNPTDMTLQISSIPLNDALLRQGIDWKKASRNEMRALVCAQCHVEYYFSEPDHGPNKKPVFPWDNGKNPENIYEYYKDKGPKQADGSFASFADWTQPVSNTRMIKVQHPDYETWYDGPHGAAGVTCADCHMPYMRLDGKKKVSMHQWISPLRSDATIDRACRQCHADKTVDYLRTRVQYTQDKTYATLLEAQDLSVKAHEAVRLATEWAGSKSPEFDKLMADARESVRKGQFYWDYVSAENGVGFHNPAKAFRTLDLSKDESQKAINLAMQATGYGIGPSLEGDIHQIVPPLLYWSREMQMDPANLEKHPWTKYLKPLPKSPLMWKGGEKVTQSPEAPKAATVSMK